MGEEPLTDPHVHLRHGEEEGCGLLGTAGVALPELVEVLQGLRAKSLLPWFSLCKCFTVSSRMSAFSSLETFSPSAWRATVMMSFNSSRHLLILARLFLSRSGFVIFLY